MTGAVMGAAGGAAAEAEVLTFRGVAERWKADRMARNKWAKNTIESIEQALRKHLLPAFGNRPIEEITRQDVKALHRSMVKTPGMANRALAWCAAICTYAIDEEIVERNPCARIEKYPEPPRDRVLSADELRRLWAALRKAPAPWGAFFRLIVLTGCCQGELEALRWDQIEGNALYLPTTKNRRPRMVALSGPALADLKALPQTSEIVWGQPLKRHLRRDAWVEVLKAAEIEGLTIHDLRRSKATFALNLGIPAEQVQVADFLLRTAADKHAENFDAQVCLGTDVSGSGLTGLSDAGVQDDDEPLATLPAMVATQLFGLNLFARRNATFVMNTDYAQHLAGLVTATENIPVFALTDSPVMVSQTGGRLMGVSVVVQVGTTNVAADTIYLGDLARGVLMYERQGLTGESSRDADFALDNTLFRFGWRYDVAVVEANQVLKFTGAV